MKFLTSPMGALLCSSGRSSDAIAMDFVTLELEQWGDQPGQPSDPIRFVEQLQTLIRGIAIHAVEGQPMELAKFEKELSEVARSLPPQSSADDLLLAVGKTLRLTEAYNDGAALIFKDQVEELRGMLKTMTETVQFVVSSSDISVKQLTLVETQLQRASTLDDIRQLKTYTSACLSMVRRESTRLQSETTARIEALKKDVDRLSVRLKVAAVEESLDPVTGLKGRAAAEQTIEEQLSVAKEFGVALFLIDQLSAINGRFGRAVGDEVVVSCAHMLARRLNGAALYRWSGPGFLAIFDPSVNTAEAGRRARHAAAEQLNKSLESGDRIALVVANIVCHVLPISPKTMKASDIFEQLDRQIESAQGSAGSKSHVGL